MTTSSKTAVSKSSSTAALITMLALLSAQGPFAIDMYLPAFPQMVEDLGASAATVQLTLTAFMLGMAVGHLIIGPLSDQYGRRRPLLVGIVVCMVATMLCAVAPNVEFLIGMRFVQGFAGAAGVVLARAIVSDSARGARAAKLFSIMMAVGGIAPVLAPLAGNGVIALAGWRGVFWALAVLNLIMLIGSIIILKESLPQGLRSNGGVRELFANGGRVLGNRRYVGFTFAFAFSMAAMFGYIAASPFVVQNILGLGTTAFSLIFALNALGLTITSVVAVRLADTLGPVRMTYIGVSGLVLFSAGLLAVVSLGDTPLVPTLVLIFLAISSLGFVFGNAAALATEQVKRHAGTGSAILGALQFTLAAIASPLVGLAGEGSAVPMAIVMLVASVVALLSLVALTRGTTVEREDELVGPELEAVPGR